MHVAPISVGTGHAGDWPSTVPERLVAEGRFGVLPGETNDAARKAFEHAVASATEADPWLREHPPVLEWFEGQFESGATPLNAPILDALANTHAAVCGAHPVVAGVPYGSDLRLFTNHAAMPAVLYGPGDVRLAHAADENVPLDEVITAAKVVAHLVADWCG
jgi:acetylornithine deacetylase